MNSYKVADAEWKVMNVIWSKEIINAKEVVDFMKESDNWNKNTTYTVLNRLIQKGLIQREEPAFICRPLATKEEVSLSETRSFIDKIYNGSLKMFVSSFLSNEKISSEELDELKKIINSNSTDKSYRKKV